MKRVGAVAVVLLSLLISAGCTVQARPREVSGVDGQVGRLHLLRVAVDAPGPSGSTHIAGSDAALLLTIANFGEAEDELVSVTAAAARQVVLRDGDEVRQAPLAVAVPAGGAAVLGEVTGRHLELSGLRSTLRTGSKVLVTFVFRDAGSVLIEVPVRSYADVPVDRVPQPEGQPAAGTPPPPDRRS